MLRHPDEGGISESKTELKKIEIELSHEVGFILLVIKWRDATILLCSGWCCGYMNDGFDLSSLTSFGIMGPRTSALCFDDYSSLKKIQYSLIILISKQIIPIFIGQTPMKNHFYQ
ncbi:MAG: hypothetical protein JEZ03_09390 [Bacteroidales bacterium]|nr:hypothetical protein [Bacteroidales bacterium]